MDYINDANNGFDYSDIKQMVKEGKAYVVISVYTLMEIIQDIFTMKDLEKRRNELLSAGDFWVQNINGILGDVSFEYGMDFLFSLKMHRNDMLLDFHNEREKLRNKIVKTIVEKKVFFYIQALSVIYLLLSDYNKKRIKKSTIEIVKRIDSNFMGLFKEKTTYFFDFLNQHIGMDFFTEKGREKDYKGRKRLNRYIPLIVCEAIAIAKTDYELDCEGKILSACGYCDRVITNYKILFENLKIEGFKGALSNSIKSTGNRHIFDKVYSEVMLLVESPILKDCYKIILKQPFAEGSIPKDLYNDFIDIINIGTVEGYKQYKIVYITSEVKWIEFIKEHKSIGCLDATREFYSINYSKAR